MKPWISKIFKILFAVFLLFFVSSKIFLFKHGFLEQITGTINYPFLYVSNVISTPFKILLQKRNSYKELQINYSNIEEKNKKLLEENIKLKSSLHFAQNSRELLDFQKRYNIANTTFAKIITSNFSEEEHYFLVNKGSAQGIEKDMIAIYKFQVIGRVVQTYKWYSKILLITDQTSKVACHTNSTNAKGIVIGENKTDSYKMEYVNHLSEVEADDFIISSGQGLVYPEGFCLGKIKTNKTKGLYHKIKIEPLVDFKALEYCLLINQEKMDAV